MKKKIIRLALLTFSIVFTSSCFGPQNYLAPPNIEGYVISYYSVKVAKFDSAYLHKNTIYEFKSDGTYNGSLDGKPVEFGLYTYRRISPNYASVILSYSDNSNQHGLDNYEIIMHFQDAGSGSWEIRYDTDALSIEDGTFKILRHGNATATREL